MAVSMKTRTGRPFYLVQRLYRSPYAENEGKLLATPKSRSNPFGYGRMGDYQLDYMGAAEFEFGTIPEANNRLAEAKKGIVLGEHNYGGHVLDFLWIEKEGEPFEAWCDWVEGRETDEYTGKVYETRPCDGKERPYELIERLEGAKAPEYGDEWRTAIWWALRGNVMWAFKDDGHLHKWIESMGSAPTEFLR